MPRASVPFNYEAFRDVRTELNLSQTRMANVLGCSVTSVRNWEHNRAAPSGHHIDKLHRFYFEVANKPLPDLFDAPNVEYHGLPAAMMFNQPPAQGVP